jgi:nickel/cobalt transporter (NicO) family protein
MAIPFDIVLGAGAIGAVHAIIPNHWLPLVAIARTEKWSNRHAMLATFLVGSFHVLGTILVGLGVSYLGLTIGAGHEDHSHVISRYILVLVGLLFILSGLRHTRRCNHHKLRFVGGGPEEHKAWRKVGILFALSAAMFLSPCLDIIGYFFSVSLLGWDAVFFLALVFALVTVPLLMLLVALGLRGVDRLNWQVLDHHGRTITGVLLVFLGIIGVWFE